MTYTIIEEKAISMAELKSELESIKKRDKELNYRSQKTEGYLATFSKLDTKKADELYKKIDKLEIPRFRDVHIKKIIDLMPASTEDLKVVMQGYSITVSAESLKKIMSVLEEAQKK